MRVALLTLLLAAALAPAVSAAPRCVAPPGTGAVDEYCETVPTDRGDRDARDDRPLSQSTADALGARGQEGAALAQALGRPPSTETGRQRGRARERRVVPATTVPAPSGVNPLDAVREAVGGDTTIGSGFLLAVLAVVVTMAGWAWVAFRRRSTS